MSINPQRELLRVSKNMARKKTWFAALLALVALAGCNDVETIDRVQTNVVAKSIFEGEWWVMSTVLEADGDAVAAAGTWAGDDGMDHAGILYNGASVDWAPVIGRIRWVIDEDFLYAYRSWEVIDGGNSDGRDDEFRGQPLAAFKIEKHFDIRRGYNPVTGEENNVIEENDTDRRWYENEFMRVDWSTNLSQSFMFISDTTTLGNWRRESGRFQIDNDASHGQFPRSYAPQFVRVGEDPDYRFAHEWGSEDAETVHFMSFTTMTLLSPGASCLQGGAQFCQTISVPMRNSFLRIPPNHEYAAQVQTHADYDRFGTFRTYQRSYVRGGQDETESVRRCTVNEDCGTNGFCNLDAAAGPVGICDGGLSENYGETDALSMYRPRHSFFRNSFRRDGAGNTIACRADWQCDDRFSGDDGARMANAGSVCDRAARVCTIPTRERELQQVTYTLSDGFPRHLVKAAFQTTASWTEVFMEGWRAAQNRVVPDYSAIRVPVQDEDPTGYCFTGSADVVGDSCSGRWDPFVSPDEYASMGVTEPFDCQIVNADSWSEPARPSSYDDYPLPSAYRWEFQGEECKFVLKSNTCDWHRTDANTHCDDVTDENDAAVRWEELGDPRHQFFNYIDQVYTPFGGVSEIRLDPTNGEIISADANYSGAVSENMAYVATEWFPVLRCTNEEAGGCAPGEEGADTRFFSGENRRAYYAGIRNHVERPVRVAPSGTDGVTIDDYGRPAMPTHALSDYLQERIEAARPRIEGLLEEDAGFQILQDRMMNLQGTPAEARMLEGLSPELMNGLFNNGIRDNAVFEVDPSLQATDRQVIDRTSPFRPGGLLGQLRNQGMQDITLARMNADFSHLTDVRSFLRQRYWGYWAEAFRGRPLGEASIRLQQMYLRSVQQHELGHSVGLRHNFGASFDRDNYGDGYFHVAMGRDLELPRLEDFNTPGDAFDHVGAQELNEYQAELRRVRNERAAAGLHNYTTASTMDYNGDLADSMGLGRYDRAAVNWNYFNLAEAFVGDPRHRSTDTLNGIHTSHQNDRVWWTSYSGGESCNVDLDCPFTAGSPSLVDGQPVFQRCIQNTRNSRRQAPCDGDTQCVCSTFTNDMDDYAAGDPVYGSNDVDNNGEVDFFPVEYLFCPDERAQDISWCSRQDAGESFMEAIDHYRRSWYEGYGSRYYRQFSRRVSMGASWGSIMDAAKIYQHVFFRYFFEPGFRSNSGALGADDQFRASAEAMNWFMELANLPDEGSYVFDDERRQYVHSGEAQDPRADLYLPPGQGFGMWSQYEDGHQGFERVSRGGVYFDKMLAMYALALRDWNLSFTIDERYFINFYDLFPLEITEFFGGIILDEQRWHAPRVDVSGSEPTIIHPNFNQGLIFGSCRVGGASQPCAAPIDETYPEPTISGTSNIWLRDWASQLALANFPVFYDSSFEQRLVIWKIGDGTGADIPDTRRDGSPACAYGAYTVEGSHELVSDAADPRCDSADDATYAVFYSDRLRTAYTAVKVTPREDYNESYEQLGFEFLRKLIDLQDRVNELETSGSNPELLRSLRAELVENESFLNQLIFYMKRFGISNTYGI